MKEKVVEQTANINLYMKKKNKYTSKNSSIDFQVEYENHGCKIYIKITSESNALSVLLYSQNLRSLTI